MRPLNTELLEFLEFLFSENPGFPEFKRQCLLCVVGVPTESPGKFIHAMMFCICCICYVLCILVVTFIIEFPDFLKTFHH